MWMDNSLIMMSSGNYGIAGACWINPPSECLSPPHLFRPLLTSQGRGFISSGQLSHSIHLCPNLLLSYRAHLSGTLQRAVRCGVGAGPETIAGDTPHLSLSDPILLLHRTALQLDATFIYMNLSWPTPHHPVRKKVSSFAVSTLWSLCNYNCTNRYTPMAFP